MNSFLNDPVLTPETYWRAVILFGRNVATYKFALGKTLLELAQEGKSHIRLQELAVPFSQHLVEHIRGGKKQITSNSSRFLDACQKYVDGEITQSQLIAETEKRGFVNVIDAFHIVNSQEIPIRFFEDDRKGKTGGIILTDSVLQMPELVQFGNLSHEIEARWGLVETAWQFDISRNLLTVQHDSANELLFVEDHSLRRIDITSSRNALNGYQKGKCFYCFRDISIANVSLKLSVDVDHFFPHILKRVKVAQPIDGVWNLVLACSECNRGAMGKFAQLPAKHYLERLHRRNEFYIESHHPLRETLMRQTGQSVNERIAFLNYNYGRAKEYLIHEWQSPSEITPPYF